MYGIAPITCVLAWVVSYRSSAQSPPLFSHSPTHVPWRIHTESAGRVARISGGDVGRGVRCTGQRRMWAGSLRPGFPGLVQVVVQTGCLPDLGHSGHPSSPLPPKRVLWFGGGACGRIKRRRLHRQFVTRRNRTELGSSKTSSDGAG